MAKKGKGKRGFGRKNRAIPVAPIFPVIGVALGAYGAAGGMNKVFIDRLSQAIVGYSTLSGKFTIAPALPFWMGELAGIGVHKAAGKVGVNRYIKKFTFGYLEL